MDMAQFDDWLDGINTHIASQAGSAGNVPRLIVVQAVRSTVKLFLTDTNLWVHRPRTAMVHADSRLLEIPRDTYICKIWACDRQPGMVDRLRYSHPNIIHLDGLNNSERDSKSLLSLDVSLSVTQNSLECPMFIYDQYYSTILSGALAGLQAMPGKAWSEPSMVVYHKQLFDQGVIEANKLGRLGINRQKSPNTIKPNYA